MNKWKFFAYLRKKNQKLIKLLNIKNQNLAAPLDTSRKPPAGAEAGRGTTSELDERSEGNLTLQAQQ